MNVRRVACLATLVALAVSVPVWAAQQIVIHTFDQTGNAFSSQNDTNGMGNFATVYDNFTFNCNPCSPNGSLSWTGEYFNPSVQGTITGWTVTFWNDNAGQPGTMNFQFITATNANETFLGTFGGFLTYTYSVAGLNTQNLINGNQYWISVVPDLGFPPQWGWSTASNAFGPCNGCDGLAYQDFFGSRSALGNDLAFTLTIGNQTTTPEPGTLFLLGSGVLGLAGAIRRKLA